MPSPFLLTKSALPLLQATIEADIKQLEKLRQQHPASAAALSSATDRVLANNSRLAEVAESGIRSMQKTYDILTQNLALQKQASDITGVISSVAAATEEMAASASEISQSAQNTASRANESYEKSQSE